MALVERTFPLQRRQEGRVRVRGEGSVVDNVVVTQQAENAVENAVEKAVEKERHLLRIAQGSRAFQFERFPLRLSFVIFKSYLPFENKAAVHRKSFFANPSAELRGRAI